MDTQKEQQRKRRESKRKRNRKPALLIVAGIALALLVLLLVRWNRPLTEIALQKGEPDRMDAAKDFLLFANDKTLTAKKRKRKGTLPKNPGFLADARIRGRRICHRLRRQTNPVYRQKRRAGYKDPLIRAGGLYGKNKKRPGRPGGSPVDCLR